MTRKVPQNVGWVHGQDLQYLIDIDGHCYRCRSSWGIITLVALSHQVLECYINLLRQTKVEDELRVLEMGAGVGAMFVRLLDRGAFDTFSKVEYTLSDTKKANLVIAINECKAALVSKCFTAVAGDQRAEEMPVTSNLTSAEVVGEKSVHLASESLCVSRPFMTLTGLSSSGQVTVHFLCCDSLELGVRNESSYHSVIAAAFLDLIDIDQDLGVVFRPLIRGGSYYFPINFDGMTHFSSKTEDLHAAEKIEKAYHNAMDMETKSGKKVSQSTAGRRLLSRLPNHEAHPLATGSSAWIVMPTRKPDGEFEYHAEEKYFLDCMLEFIETTVRGRPEVTSTELETYIGQCKLYMARIELLFMAQNVDYCGIQGS